MDTLVRILEPRPGDTIYDPTGGSGGMLVRAVDYMRERGHPATNARYFAQEMNWGNAVIGKINSVLHGLEAEIRAGASTIIDPLFLVDGEVRKFSRVLANFPFSDDYWWLKPELQTDDKAKKKRLKKEIFGKEDTRIQSGASVAARASRRRPPNTGITRSYCISSPPSGRTDVLESSVRRASSSAASQGLRRRQGSSMRRGIRRSGVARPMTSI